MTSLRFASFVSLLPLSVALLAPSLAHADEPVTPEPLTKSTYPMAYVDRPLTLPARMIEPEFSVSLLHLDGFGFLGAANVVGLNLGASYGVIDNLTVYAMPLTMSIVTGTRTDSSVYYRTLRIGAIYRFLHTDAVDIGAQLEVGGAAKFNTLFATAKIPVLVRLNHIVRLDTPAYRSR